MMIQLQGLLSTITFLDVIDIVVVAYFLYRLFLMLKNTRAATLGKGLMVLIGFTLICRWLNLHVISWLLEKSMTVIMVALPVVFQPELRRALEQIGRGKLFHKGSELDEQELEEMLDSVALWCGIANGAEDILLPERYNYDEQELINNIINNRKRGKKHHIVINAEGIGHSTSMARRIEAATGVETRATILGHMQRGGSPTCRDRVYASVMGAYAADLLAEGKTNRVVAFRDGEYKDFDIDEALSMQKDISEYMVRVAKAMTI